jgi:hypothetical protein
MTASLEPARRHPGPDDASSLASALVVFIVCGGFAAWMASLRL